MVCPGHELISCRCNKNMKKSIKKYLWAPLRNNTHQLLKILLVTFIIIGISGADSANSLSEKSISSNINARTVQNGTVYIESGLSGIAIVKDPLLKKKMRLTVNYSSTGSGFLVNRKGYIISAFHVVSDPESRNINNLKKMESKDIKKYVEKEALMYYLKNIDPQLSHKLLKKRFRGNQGDLNLERNKNYLTDVFLEKGWISTNSYRHSIYVKGPALNGINTNNSMEAHLIDMGNSKEGKDIALLKVNPEDRILPSLTISSQDPKIGEKISIHGYPNSKQQNSSSHNINQSSTTGSSNSPSISSGHLNERLTNSKGIIYYKSNAIADKGYSGGPVVDSKNNVVGILIYGILKINKPKNQKRIGTLFLSRKYITEISNRNKVSLKF